MDVVCLCLQVYEHSFGSNAGTAQVLESAQQSSMAINPRLRDQLQLAKSAMTFVMCLHISELWASHEVVCGLCGAASSVIDLFLLFPRKPPSAKPAGNDALQARKKDT
jgi:hypothetical protein